MNKARYGLTDGIPDGMSFMARWRPGHNMNGKSDLRINNHDATDILRVVYILMGIIKLAAIAQTTYMTELQLPLPYPLLIGHGRLESLPLAKP